jgi:hypothetical protein
MPRHRSLPLLIKAIGLTLHEYANYLVHHEFIMITLNRIHQSIHSAQQDIHTV